MSVRTLAVIPARLAASRLPGKPLLDLGGRPVIQWVWDATVASGVFDEVIVATPDAALAETVTRFGGQACMTSDLHVTGTDRVAEVAMRYEHRIVANIQGDQPFVTTEMLQSLVGSFDDEPAPKMTTISTRLTDPEHAHDPNTVKVVLDQNGDALYFSRAAIPFTRDDTGAGGLHHLGLYAFDRDFLIEFSRLGAGPLEVSEGLEQLRALENGYRIRVGEVSVATLEINTRADFEAAKRLVEEGVLP